MSDDRADLEGRLRRLEKNIDALLRRVEALEGGAFPAPGNAPEGEAQAISEFVGAAGGSDRSEILSLAGRTFIVFGGAFLLRALTSSGQLPRGAGIAIGLAYAVIWLAAADRAGGVGRRLSGSFHGIATIVIGFPLLWEASTRFNFLSPVFSAGALAGLTALALAVAWHRRLRIVGGLAVLGAIATAVALVRASGEFIPFSVLLIAIGVVTLWLGYERDWSWLGWPAALVADAVVTGLAMQALRAERVSRPEAVIGTLLFLVGGYVGSVALRTLVWRQVVIPFELVQTLAALPVGLGGAIAVAHASGTGETAIGLASLMLGGAAYAAVWARSRRAPRLNFQFYAALALVLTLTGCSVLLPRLILATVLAGLAALTAWFGRRLTQSVLVLHSAAYCTVAAGVSGLLSFAVLAFTSTPAAGWGSLGAAEGVTLAATALCLAIPRPRSRKGPRVVAGLARLMLALLLVLESGGAVVASIAPAVTGVPPAASTLATLRTAVLAAMAVLLAWARRYERTMELGWLLYPLLFVGGCKLLVEDFRYSEPSALFVALGLFGVALVVTARLVRRGPSR